MEKKISPIFGESVSTEKIKRRNYSSTEGTGSRSRFYLIPIALVLAIIIVLGRAFFLQVVRGSYYRNLSDNNRIKTIIIHAPRGIISDRQGKPLVYNIPGYRQTVNGKTRLIGQDEAITLISQGAKDLEIDSLRDYPYKESIAHVLGYLGQVSEDELKTSEFVNYNSGDVIGKMGIERQYEKFLKGEDGAALAEIDSQGKVVRKLGQSEGISGRNIKLTIDLDLQKKAYSAMGKVKKGALVVSTPTGEILALVSKPSFDSNLFTLGKDYKVANAASYKSVSEVLNDKENQPFLNRAIGGAYPPGSTFKIVVAVGGLADKIIGTKYSIKDTGVIKVGDFSFSNWYFTGYGGTDGDVNVIKGLKRSNDIFFYKLAEKIGVDRLSATAQKFGLGKILGLDLQGEVSGTVPTKEWKQEKIGESWYLGDTYNYGIGQGYLLTTPLQVNIWTQAIANNGNIYKPHLLKDLGDRKLNDRFLDQ
ncbi:MAG: hypothetical protein HY426_03200, partial [Candidatus Levybacteria bacterium]|nr:hypothetical protein [Candidatus Levybacteria bacterium]